MNKNTCSECVYYNKKTQNCELCPVPMHEDEDHPSCQFFEENTD